MEDILTSIANLGFPIAVAVWLLVRTEHRIQALSSAICDLREAILRLSDRDKDGV